MTFLLRGVAFGMFGVVVVYGAVLAAIYIKPLRTAVTIAYMLAFAPPAGTPLHAVASGRTYCFPLLHNKTLWGFAAAAFVVGFLISAH